MHLPGCGHACSENCDSVSTLWGRDPGWMDIGSCWLCLKLHLGGQAGELIKLWPGPTQPQEASLSVQGTVRATG